jgi:molecular chaperone DnaK (HSP70)
MSTFQIDFSDANKQRVIGIDLGTTNSLVAFQDLTGPVIIPGPDESRIVPSVVAVDEAGEIVVGEAAREVLLKNPDRAVYSAKRLMGRGIEDVRDELSIFPFRIAQGSEQVLQLKLGDRTLTPPQIGAEVLKELKRRAEAYLGETVTQAVITVPAYFNDAQRQATKDAGRIAGLEVLRLVNEPTAASLAYGLDKRKTGVVAVYDFGGGTFDISILKLQDGIFEVLATHGDTHLGGDDIDNLLLQIAIEDIESEWKKNLASEPEAVQRLRRAVIAAKEQLSFVPFVTIAFDWQGQSYRRELKRELFNQLITPIVNRTLVSCRECLKDAGVNPEDIAEVVMVGGSTRIPLVREAVENVFRTKWSPSEPPCRQAS